MFEVNYLRKIIAFAEAWTSSEYPTDFTNLKIRVGLKIIFTIKYFIAFWINGAGKLSLFICSVDISDFYLQFPIFWIRKKPGNMPPVLLMAKITMT